MAKAKRKNRGYVRVSTLKDSQKDSPEHQEAFIREHMAREGLTPDRIYEDRDTATSIMARDDVQQIIKDAKRGEIESIWFASLSRFSRDTLDALSLKRTLVNALKVRVVSIEDGYDSAKKDDELLFGVKSVINQNQSEQISVATRRGIRQSAAKGNYTGKIPLYGYEKAIDGKRKYLKVVPEKAAIVKKIFDLYVGGMGEKSIVNFLNGDNETKTPIPSYKGGIWGVSSVQRILENENYTGYTVSGRFTVETAYNDLNDLMNRGKKQVMKPKSDWERTTFQTHEAIISKETFDLAQEIRLQRGGGKRGGWKAFVNVFAKFIFCAECGSAMVTMVSRVRGNEYRYLMCSRRRRTGKVGCSNGKWIPYFEMRDELISNILKRLRERLRMLSTKGAKEIDVVIPEVKAKDSTKKLEKRIDDNRKLLFEIRRQHMLGDLDTMQYEFEKEQYEKEIAESEKKLDQMRLEEKKSLDKEKLARDTKRALDQLTKLKSYEDVEKTRLLLKQCVKRIDVNQEGKITIQTFI